MMHFALRAVMVHMMMTGSIYGSTKPKTPANSPRSSVQPAAVLVFRRQAFISPIPVHASGNAGSNKANELVEVPLKSPTHSSNQVQKIAKSSEEAAVEPQKKMAQSNSDCCRSSCNIQ